MKATHPCYDWMTCRAKPKPGRLVLIWHRSGPYSRVYKFTLGGWNGKWWWETHGEAVREVYQPVLWRDLEEPEGEDIEAFPSWNHLYSQ